MKLVLEVYRLINQLPSEEQFALGSQLRRAVVSVPSNIAEGFGRESHKDFVRYLVLSRGSLYEVGTQLEVASQLGYVQVNETIRMQMDELSKMLGALIRKLRDGAVPSEPSTNHQAPSTNHQALGTRHQAPGTRH